MKAAGENAGILISLGAGIVTSYAFVEFSSIPWYAFSILVSAGGVCLLFGFLLWGWKSKFIAVRPINIFSCWVMATIIVSGVWIYFFPTKSDGPCAVRADIEELETLLRIFNQSHENSSHRDISIFVPLGRVKTCSYAEDLHQAFLEGDWSPTPVKESSLTGAAVWFYAPDDDKEAIRFYDQASLHQLVHFEPTHDGKLQWRIYVNDQWPNWVSEVKIRKY